MANIWNVKNNVNLGVLEEGKTLKGDNPPITLSVNSQATTQVISGKLPPGLRLLNNEIVGTPSEVARQTDFRFVIRASIENEFEDRTFAITIFGSDEPQWVTAEGSLPIGENNAYYILDSSPVNFQLQATDKDLEAGQTLEYFIASGDGELPPGIELTSGGVIQGIVDPVLALEKAASQGYYDDNAYGGFPFDFGVRPANGYDSFFYDIEFYDLSIPTKSPKKLNRNYKFTVSVSDGDTIAKRDFQIYVVGDDFLRTDNTLMTVGSSTFTADNTHIRTPIWLTPADLGYRRANNYVTLFLDVIDKETLNGFVGYVLENVNDDGSASVIPPGLVLDSTTGELSGFVPYQPSVTKEYKFTINAIRFSGADQRKNVDIEIYEDTDVGATSIKIIKNSSIVDLINETITIKGVTYAIINVNNAVLQYDEIILHKPLETFTRKGLVFTESISVDAVNPTLASKKKTFTVKLLGEVDSRITWNSPNNLGTISANLTSVFAVNASTSVPNAVIRYSLISGTLPPGLNIALDGEIFGKVTQFGENFYRSFWQNNKQYNANDVVRVQDKLYISNSAHTSTLSGDFIDDQQSRWSLYTFQRKGLPTFDGGSMVFDGDQTTIDKSYTFTVQAEDQFGFSATQKTFTIFVDDPNDFIFSNLIVKPMFKRQEKFAFNSFISDPIIFNPAYIYRPNDPEFGVQKNVKMLVYGGIETKNLEEYVAAAAKNHKRKKLKFGNVRTAVAKDEGTNNVVYEIVYIEVIDPADAETAQSIIVQTKNKLLINSINYEEQDNSSEIIDNNSYRHRPIDNTIKIDSDAVKISENLDQVKYITNLTNMRKQIAKVGVTDRNFLPLWMRTPQENSIEELGFVPAVPLAYCKPGTSEQIFLAIKNSNFDFTALNFEIDRYIIDSTRGNSNEQYILFANYSFNV